MSDDERDGIAGFDCGVGLPDCPPFARAVEILAFLGKECADAVAAFAVRPMPTTRAERIEAAERRPHGDLG